MCSDKYLYLYRNREGSWSEIIISIQLKDFKADIDKLITRGHAKESAIFTVLKQYIVKCKLTYFEGNGYNNRWKTEAVHQRLDYETSIY